MSQHNAGGSRCGGPESARGDSPIGTAAIIGTRGYPSYYGGFETLVRRLAPFLADEGWGLTVYGRPGTVRLEDPNRDPRVEVKMTRGFDSKALSTPSYGLTASIDAMFSGVDVALIMNVANGYWLPLLKSRGIRTVVNVDGIEWERAKWGTFARRAFVTGAKMCARYADELVFDAVAIQRYWEENFGRSGTFIPYGGDPDYQALDAPKYAPGSYVLMVARFVPENSFAEFLQAVQLLDDEPVVVVGSSGFGGPLDEAMRRLADRKNVEWLGHVNDDALLFSLWENCGAYFHGHSVGGTNPALVQAMACGAPTVARDTPYNREVLGDAGEFVAPDPRQIADAIAGLLSDKTRQRDLAQSARERASKYYTWETVCSDYSHLMLAKVGL